MVTVEADPLQTDPLSAVLRALSLWESLFALINTGLFGLSLLFSVFWTECGDW